MQHMLRQPRQKSQQGGRFQKRRPRRIGHQHIARPYGLQKAWHTQGGVGPQLKRVEVLVVHPFEQTMHRHQPAQGFKKQPLVAHDQVAALHQAQAQVAGQIGVLKIGFVVRPGGQQGDVGSIASRAQCLEAVHERAVSGGQPLHLQRLKSLGKLARHRQAVFQQIAQPGRGLAALAHNPPIAIRSPRQVKRGHMQMHAAHRLDAVHGAQIARVALHQRRWQKPLRQKSLRSVHIGHHRFQQPHAL